MCACALNGAGDTHYLDTARIVASAPAHIHSLALAADGRAFAWGCASSSVLSTSTEIHPATHETLNYFWRSMSDSLLSYGANSCGSDGRTGLRALMRGPRGAKRTLKCYISTPSVIEGLEGRHVQQLTSGR